MEINLDGGEKDVLKAIGLGGQNISGELVIERCPGMGEAEFVDTLRGLMMMGYVLADKMSFHTYEDVKYTEFHVNSGYIKDLREAIDPRYKPQESRGKRVRRE